MTLHEKIKTQMQEALKAREELKLSVLRGLLSAFTNELVSKKRKPNEELRDDEALFVIQRGAKQRKDSIEQFRNGGRDDLADKEKAELKIIEEYLPEKMSRDDIEKIARAKKAELGMMDRAKMGILMGAVMKELKNRADGNEVKEIVESLF